MLGVDAVPYLISTVTCIIPTVQISTVTSNFHLREKGDAGLAEYILKATAICTAPTCANGRSITFMLATSDLNGVKSNADICTKSSDCVLSFNSSFIMDLAGNNVTVSLDACSG